MSRSYRGREFTPRWRTASTTAKPRQDKAGTVAYLNRMVRRMNRAAGYDDDKLPSYWEYDVRMPNPDGSDNCLHLAGRVIAQTRSEARARIKAAIGISRKKRLPVGAQITKGEVCHA